MKRRREGRRAPAPLAMRHLSSTLLKMGDPDTQQADDERKERAVSIRGVVNHEVWPYLL